MNPNDTPAPRLVIRRDFPEEGPELDSQFVHAGGREEPSLPEAEQRREDISFGPAEWPKIEPPSWFRELARRRAPAEEAVQALLERLPEIAELRHAQMLLNEIGRIESAGAVISRTGTQDLFNQLHQRHRQRR